MVLNMSIYFTVSNNKVKTEVFIEHDMKMWNDGCHVMFAQCIHVASIA